MTSKTGSNRLLDSEFAAQRAEILRALGNPVRLRIVALLSGAGETTVGALAEALALPQSSISRQLSWLRLNALVDVRREGSFSYYSIAMPQLTTLLGCLENCCRGNGGGTTTDTGVGR
jgi:DNA-binding transcriptional ArsR family regulator